MVVEETSLMTGGFPQSCRQRANGPKIVRTLVLERWHGLGYECCQAKRCSCKSQLSVRLAYSHASSKSSFVLCLSFVKRVCRKRA